MKFILPIFLFFNCTNSLGQKPFVNDYPLPVDSIITYSDSIGKEPVYNIKFLDKSGHVIKNRSRSWLVDYNSKRGYSIDDDKTYFIFKDSLVQLEINFGFIHNSLNKSEFEYNKNGKQTKSTLYYYSRKLTGDTLFRLRNSDYFLNHPDQLPKTGWIAYQILKKDYNEYGDIIYRGYFISEKPPGPITLDREKYFVYNQKQQLVEHISLTRKKCKLGICGTDMMQTFEYDCDGRLVRKNWFEDGRYQSYSLYSYLDTSIIEEDYFFSNPYGEYIKGKTNPYNRGRPLVKKYVYDKVSKKYIEENYKIEFRIIDDSMF